MPRRTMTITRLWYHEMRRPNNIGEVASLPDGADLLTYFHAFAKAIAPDQLVTNHLERYTSLTELVPHGRTVTVAAEVGRYGENGSVRDVVTHRKVADYGKGQAPVVVTHGVLLVPSTGTSALLYIERSSGQSGVTALLETFIRAFNLRYRDHRLRTESLVESEAWLAKANLTRVSARLTDYSTDVAEDAGGRIVGDLAHTLVPARGARLLPRPLWEALRDKRIKRSKLLGFRDDQEVDYVDVTLEHGGQTKTFELGKEKRPPISEVVSTAGQDQKTLSWLRNHVLSQATDHFERYDVQWSETDQLGVWSEEQLSERVVAGES